MSCVRTKALRRATLKWLDSIVIGEKLCPFAPPVSKAPKLSIAVSHATSEEEIINDVTKEAKLIVQGIKKGTDVTDKARSYPETSLIVIDSDYYPSLSCFRNFVQLSWRIQSECLLQNKYQDLLQIVLFHPHAVHDTYAQSNQEIEDVANYTIRAPFPTFHLLRQDQVLSAVKSGFQDLEGLPGRNKAKLRKEGIEIWSSRLKECYL